MSVYVYGEDTYGARREIDRIAQEIGAGIEWVDREQLEERSFREIVDRSSSSLFGTTVSVVRDVSAMPKSIQEDIVDTLRGRMDGPDNDSVVFWDRLKPDKRSGFYRAVKQRAKEFPALEVGQAISWVRDYASHDGGSIASDAARELIRRVGTNRWALRGELEKLMLLNGDITVDVVQSYVEERTVEGEVFAMLDAFSRGDTVRAVRGVEALLSEGSSEFYILSMFAYQFRVLYTIRTFLDRGYAGRDIAKKAKLHPFVIEKNQRAARTFSVEWILSAMTRVMATDFAIKQGHVDARTGVIMLVVGLVRQQATR